MYDPESLTIDTAVWDMPCPVLGICYGMQLMCQNLGGKVEEATAGEYGRACLDVVKSDARLFAGVDAKSDAWMSHRDRVVALPDGYVGSCLECCRWSLQGCSVAGCSLLAGICSRRCHLA